MTLEALIHRADRHGASDLHLEPGMPATLRVRGELVPIDAPLSATKLHTMARELLSDDQWNRFASRRSCDLARTIAGVRCRINVLTTSRGVGFAVRLLSRVQPTLETFNLHPELADLVRRRNGLIVISGPTGSGKSSTIAALIHEINTAESRHIVTLERPIEFQLKPRHSLIRQREVGVDTPSFDQGLLDSLREDPDVILVGEMRSPETIRLTLNAAETGHLVLTTVHSANVPEALHRIVAAFPPEIQPMVCAQLADSLVAVICQHLKFDERHGIRIPELEICINTVPIKNNIRQGQFFRVEQALETGGRDGQYTWDRYRAWLAQRNDFAIPAQASEPVTELDEQHDADAAIEPVVVPRKPSTEDVAASGRGSEDDVIVIQPPDGSLRDILDEL